MILLPKQRAQHQALARFLYADDGTFTRDGEVFIAWLRDFCYLERPTIKIGGNGMVDTHASAIAEGRREVALHIMKLARVKDDDMHHARHAEGASPDD